MPAVAVICGLFVAAPLRAYQPQAAVSGTIRNFGSGLGGLVDLWERGFAKVQPAVRFDDHLPTSDAPIPALVTGVADLAPDGGEATLTESLSFYEVHGYAPTWSSPPAPSTSKAIPTGWWSSSTRTIRSKSSPSRSSTESSAPSASRECAASSGRPRTRAARSATSAPGDSSASPAGGPTSPSRPTATRRPGPPVSSRRRC